MMDRRGRFAKLLIVLGSAITLISFQNCTKVGFSIDGVAKQSTLDNSTVFGDGAKDYPTEDTATNTPDFPSEDDIPGSTPDFPSEDDVPGSTPDSSGGTTVSVTPNPVCGPKMNSEKMSVLATTSKIVAVLYKSSSGSMLGDVTPVQVWDSDADSKRFKEQLALSKNIEFQVSSPLTEGMYSFVFWDAAKAQAPYKYSMNSGAKAVAPIQDTVAEFIDVNSAFRIDKYGKLRGMSQVANVLVGFDGDAACAEADTIDPLLLQLNTKSPQPIALTAPEQGVMFDLLGALNSHQQVKTAWFESSATENYFLVLPNGQGQVLGINELFGDATLGPDMKFAKQGFHALAKHDEDKDRIITSADSVFNSLKLWKDDNLDGIAQASELHSLDEKGVIAIDLKYDRRYKEVDQHGNMVRYKSVVVMKDNSYGLVYDLYLRYIK